MPDRDPDAVRLQRFLRAVTAARAQPVACGPYDLYPDPHEHRIRELNYAIPVESADGATFAAALPQLEAAFRERGLLARFEFVEGAAPELAAVLDAAGYKRERASFAMTCTPAAFVLPERARDVDFLGADASDADVRGSLRVRRLAYDPEGPPVHDDAVTAFRAPRGWNHAVLREDGAVVAVGSGSDVQAGWAEVAGIGVDPAFRRRGFGGAITAAIAQRAFTEGATTAFLTAGDASAASVYERVGFRASRFVVAAYRLP